MRVIHCSGILPCADFIWYRLHASHSSPLRTASKKDDRKVILFLFCAVTRRRRATLCHPCACCLMRASSHATNHSSVCLWQFRLLATFKQAFFTLCSALLTELGLSRYESSLLLGHSPALILYGIGSMLRIRVPWDE